MCSGPEAGWNTLCLCQSSRTGFFPCRRTSSPGALYKFAGRSSDHWRLQQLLCAGDIEPHPGPPRKRPAPSQDLLQADILPSSAARYASALFEFAQFLAVRDIKSVSELAKTGLPCLVDWTVRYLRVSFHGGCLSASQVGTLLAALRRYITLVRTLGGDLLDPTSHFSVLWRLHRSWSLAIPCEFRTPVPHSVALAVAVTSWLLGWPVLSFLTLLSFHCLLRPAEARSLRWCDLHCFTEDENCRYPGVYGLIGIRLTKTLQMHGHAAHQHVLVESEGLGRLMRALIWHFAPEDRLQQLWTLRESQHLAQFYVVLQRLGVRSQLTVHGLRGGGATEHWLSQRDIPNLRRRGRWTSERTLERYVQEGAFCLHTLSLGNDSASKIQELATLAPSFFAGVLPDPPPSPATTEKTERDE